MDTVTIDLLDKQTTLQELLSQVRKGVMIILTEGDVPIAQVTPAPKAKKPRTPDLHPDSIWVADDFDDPLPDEFWLGEDA